MAERVIVHLDMDAFFAAVEQRDRPEAMPGLASWPVPIPRVNGTTVEAGTIAWLSACS